MAGALAVVALGAVAWRGGQPRPAAPAHAVRLAVLPFDNFTGNADQQFFVDGLHEELTYRLGQIHPQQLAVIGRTSMLQYKGSTKTIADVARELRVDYVLEGSVRRSAPRVRITAQLIRGSDQSHVWTESYERSWSDLLAIQKDIGARVAESLTLELVPAYQAQMARDASVSADAYEDTSAGCTCGTNGRAIRCHNSRGRSDTSMRPCSISPPTQRRSSDWRTPTTRWPSPVCRRPPTAAPRHSRP